jgi:hypothetical protein
MADLGMDASPLPIELVDDTTGFEAGVNSSREQLVHDATIATDLGIINADLTGGGQKTQIVDGSGNVIGSVNNQENVRDVLDKSSQYRAQSVTTSAAEALGAGTILANRKLLHITPTNGTVYWGYSNAVTTTTGTPLFPNNTLWLSVTDNVHVYVIAGATTDTRIGEVS